MSDLTNEYNQLIDDFIEDIKHKNIKEQCNMLEYVISNKNLKIGFNDFVYNKSHPFLSTGNWTILR